MTEWNHGRETFEL